MEGKHRHAAKRAADHHKPRGNHNEMKKQTIISIIVAVAVIAVVAVAVGFLWRAPAGKPFTEVTTPPQPLTQLTAVPKPISDLLDLSEVKPYNIQEGRFPGGAAQYIVSWRTGHLTQNYNLLKEGMVKENKFTLTADQSGSGGFVLGFVKGKDSFQAKGVADGSKGERGTITLSLYSTP